MSETKFTTEELNRINEIRLKYQELGVQLVQAKLSIKNVTDRLDSLIEFENNLVKQIEELNNTETAFVKDLEAKYGKGEINTETGIFTPAE